MATSTWDGVYLRLRHELEGEIRAAQIAADFGADFDSFEASLDSLVRQYASKGIAALVKNKIAPHFDQLKSFEKAVAAVTSNNMTAGFVWAGVQAILECICRFSTHIDDTFDQLEKFYKSFPLFEEYISIFPQERRLELVLRNLYDCYGQFCALVIRYTLKRPIFNMVENLWSSKSPRKLRDVEAKFARYKADFDDLTTLAFHKHVVGPSARKTSKPSANTVIRRHTKYFSGETVLAVLHKRIRDARPSLPSEPVSCVVHGMGGIGKTQLAVEYYFAYEKDFLCHFWVAAETPTSLKDSFNQIAAKVLDRLPTPQETVNEVRGWLESTEMRWLLIFDNVEDWDSVKLYVPSVSRSNSVILMTSQVEDLKHWTTFHHQMKSLEIGVGADLLLKFVYSDTEPPESELEPARYLSELFGGLPLAMAHIGGFVSQKQGSLSKYRDQADRNFASSWRGKPSTVQEYERRLENVFDIALTELSNSRPKARQLIDVMAFLNPDSIPEALLITNLEGSSSGHPHTYTEDELEEMTPDLVKRSLVHRERDSNGDPVFTIHRALQHTLLVKLDEDPTRRVEIFNQVHTIVRQFLPETSPTQTPDEKLWPQLEKAVPHALRLCRIYMSPSQNRLPGSIQLARLFYDAGFHTWEQWNPTTKDGIIFLETAETILRDSNYDIEGKLYADIHSIMSMLLDQIGISQRTAVVTRRTKATAIRKKVLDLEIEKHRLDPAALVDPVTELLYYNAVNDEGRSCLQSNLFEEAGKAFELCYGKYREWGDEETIPFEYAKYYHNMSYVHMYQGNYAEALRLATLGVKITERKGRSGRYWWFKYDLACIELQSGNLPLALASHLEILEAREKICGPASEMTIESDYTVGAMYHHLGKLELAEAKIRESIKKAKHGGWHEVALGRARLHLARILRERNVEAVEATSLENDARELLRSYQKLDHPDYLQGSKDELAVFDNMQPVFDGRFTGRLLLLYIQEHHRAGSLATSVTDNAVI